MSTLRVTVIPPERRAAWSVFAQAAAGLADEYLDALGRDVVEELRAALTSEAGLVGVMVEPEDERSAPPALVAHLEDSGAGGTWVSDRVAAELLPMTTNRLLRGLLHGAGAQMARALEAGGRRHRRRRLAADSGSMAVSGGAVMPRSFHDPITAAEAAPILGVKERRVRQLAQDGKLPNAFLGGRLVLERGDVEDLALDRSLGHGHDDREGGSG